jgi:prepilin-type N-terminal cleavage/methylation domain-containing protein
MLLNLKHHKAFSLAELAITLSLIGILAVSLLPMISNSQAGPRKYTATLKTTLTTIEHALSTAMLRGDRLDSYAVIQETLKPERSCPSNSSTQGCWNNTTQGASGESGQPGFILKNGVALVGLDDTTFRVTTDGMNGWLIDANGADGPNQANVDQLLVNMCSGVATTCNDPSGGGHKVATGVFVPGSAGANATRFDEIME